MEYTHNPQDRWEKLERLHAEILAQQPEREREHQRLVAEVDAGLVRLRQTIARLDHLDALERGEDGFDAY